MSDNFQLLVNSSGAHIARNIVQAQIVYPRTVNLTGDKAILELNFDGTLLDVIQNIENSIELKAIDTVKDSIILLKMIEEFKASVLLDQADYLLIYKGGFDVLKLRNEKNPNSGRSLYIEINSVRNELIRYTEAMRGRQFQWLENGTAFVGLLITFLAVLNAYHRK